MKKIFSALLTLLLLLSIPLAAHAESNQSVAGVRLNRNQGLELKNLVISLPDGIVVKNNNQ